MNNNKVIMYIFCVLFALKTYSVGTVEEIAMRWGTDKSSIAHGYTHIYESYFEPLRTEHIKFLEIGFLGGASAHLWEEYFPNAELYFIDNDAGVFNESKRKEFSARCHFFVGNQQSEHDLLLFLKQCGGEFDVIVDDGGHTMEQQIVSFKMLFPQVKSGGLYIIEDLHTSYWAHFGGGPGDGSGKPGDGKTRMRAGRQTTIHFLKHLIDDVNYIGAQTGHANKEISSKNLSALTLYQKGIRSIHFYSSLVVIIKR